MVTARWNTGLLLISSVLLFASSQAIALGGGLEDSLNILDQLDQYLGPKEFATQFKVGDVFQQSNQECVGSGWPCEDTNFTVGTEVASDHVVFKYTYPSGKVQLVKMLRSYWDEHKGNLLRMHISNLNKSGISIRLDSIQEGIRKLILNGKERLTRTRIIECTVSNGQNVNFQETHEFSNEIPGIAQQVYFFDKGSGFREMTRSRTITSFHRELDNEKQTQ